MYCVYLAVFVNFASGSTAVLCSEVLKWVSHSVVLKLLFALRGVCERKKNPERIARRNLPQADFAIAVTRLISVPCGLKNDIRYLHTGLMLPL